MAINKVDLTVTQLVNDLNEGFTWLKKDDLGYGSIEVKYGANPNQIAAIRKHPALKDAETTLTIFNIIDDTNNEKNDTKSSESISNRSSNKVEEPLVQLEHHVTAMDTSAAESFANL